MPEDFDPSQIKADINDSILTIEVPKIEREKKRKIEL
jgi:HSP20 family molecular chaperone IbpA